MSSIEMWGGVADAWDRNAAFIEEHTAPATRRMFEFAALLPGDRVLELACGPGELGIAAAGIVGDDGHVLLSDGAPEMLAVAERRTQHLANVGTAVVELEDIQLESGSFDVVLCRHGLMLARNPRGPLEAIHRVLTSGGRLVTGTWGRREDNAWIGLLFDAIGEQFGVEFPPAHVPSPLSMDHPELVQRLFTEAGLVEARAEVVTSPSAFATLEDWWTLVPELAGPVAKAMAGIEPEIRQRIRERALLAAESVGKQTQDGRIELGGSIVVAVGTKPRG
jgi:SAM-dependent methyltransferase